MGANPHANGGLLLRDLRMPDFRDYAVDVPTPGTVVAEATTRARRLPARRHEAERRARNFRVFAPDELASNRLGAIFEVTDRAWMAETPARGRPPRPGRPGDGDPERAHLPGLARGVPPDRAPRLLHDVRGVRPHRRLDVQPARQVAEGDRARRSPGAAPIASLNYLLTSHVWRQDHNGFSHQDPGFLDHVVNKKAEVIRVYLPPDANTLLSVMDHCLRSRDYVNVIVAGKQPALQYLDMDEAVKHCTAGIGIWEWATNDRGHEPDVVMACCGDIPTLETLAAVDLLREYFPELRDPGRSTSST